MKKTIIGAIMLLLDLIFVVAGVTCMIVSAAIGQHGDVNTALSIVGFIGIGAGIGSFLVTVGVPLIISTL